METRTEAMPASSATATPCDHSSSRSPEAAVTASPHRRPSCSRWPRTRALRHARASRTDRRSAAASPPSCCASAIARSATRARTPTCFVCFRARPQALPGSLHLHDDSLLIPRRRIPARCPSGSAARTSRLPPPVRDVGRRRRVAGEPKNDGARALCRALGWPQSRSPSRRSPSASHRPGARRAQHAGRSARRTRCRTCRSCSSSRATACRSWSRRATKGRRAARCRPDSSSSRATRSRRRPKSWRR